MFDCSWVFFLLGLFNDTGFASIGVGNHSLKTSVFHFCLSASLYIGLDKAANSGDRDEILWGLCFGNVCVHCTVAPLHGKFSECSI